MKLDLIKDGIQIVNYPFTETILKIKKIVSKHFSKEDKYYSTLARNEFHKLVEDAQTEINDNGILQEIVRDINPIAKDLSQYEELSWVSVLKLRAIRPIKFSNINDAVPFHRETLYANKQMAYQHNLWIPISLLIINLR